MNKFELEEYKNAFYINLNNGAESSNLFRVVVKIINTQGSFDSKSALEPAIRMHATESSGAPMGKLY